jgi:hypothetical protein
MASKQPDDNCGTCHKKVSTGISCEICYSWWHLKCVNLVKESFDFLSGCDQVHWYCETCNNSVGKFVSDLAKLSERISSVEKQQLATDGKFVRIENNSGKMYDKMIAVEQEQIATAVKLANVEIDLGKVKDSISMIEDIRGSISSLKAQQLKAAAELDKTLVDFRRDLDKFGQNINVCEQKIEVEELTKSLIQDGKWSDVVKRHVEDRMEDVRGEIGVVQKTIEQTKKMADNEREKEMRKKNVVLFQVKESAETKGWKEQQEMDIKFVCDMFSHIIDEKFEGKEFNKFFRLGRRNFFDKDHDIPCRPILIEFNEGTTKNYIMNHLNRMKLDERYKGIVISHDLTVSEREQCKKLAEEAKEMQDSDESGEYLYRVRGLPGNMRIVKFKKRSHIQTEVVD